MHFRAVMYSQHVVSHSETLKKYVKDINQSVTKTVQVLKTGNEPTTFFTPDSGSREVTFKDSRPNDGCRQPLGRHKHCMIACSRFSVSGDDRKAGGRRAGSGTSGIRDERDQGRAGSGTSGIRTSGIRTSGIRDERDQGRVGSGREKERTG